MSNLTRDIGTEDMKIEEFVKLLKEDKLLVPTFQRDFVWEPSNILKLWDSMYRFYPIGSILYWETDSYLHTHRRLGGYTFPHDEDAVKKFKEWKYILDGQQRSTSLLVCMLGGTGRIEGSESFNYMLYFDGTKGDFFFAADLKKRLANVSDERFLVRVRDVSSWGFEFYREISKAEGFDADIEQKLQQLSKMFNDYRLSVVHIRGVAVSEVCDIFERINQEGKSLHPVDIIVARTYRSPSADDGSPGFYLRDNLNDLEERLASSGSRWDQVDNLLVIQMVAMCLRKDHTHGRNPFGITPAALDNLNTSHFQRYWSDCERAILDTVKFLTDQQILGPGMLPFAYLALPLCSYLFRNKKPNRDLARQWFWRNALGLESFSNSTDVYHFATDYFGALESGDSPTLQPLLLSRSRIVQSNYFYRNAFSRAVLAWFAVQRPLDFSDRHAEVLDNVYLVMSQAPNLHHIYPQNFLKQREDLPTGASPDSLMNICFLRAITNIQISDTNPLEYFGHFRKNVPDFDDILRSHLIPTEYTTRSTFDPQDYRDFLYARADWFCRTIKESLPQVEVTIAD